MVSFKNFNLGNTIQFFLVLIILLPLASLGQGSTELLQKELSKMYSDSSLPGFAVAIIKEDSIMFQESFGYEDITAKTPFSLDQRFFVASISKTFIGLSLMKLVEEGQLELTTDINNILPFKVTNPHCPKSVITVEQLARHTSSILNGDLGLKSWYLNEPFTLSKKAVGKTAYKDFNAWSQNKKSSLGEFLERCLSPNGDLYSKRNFSKHRPGSNYEYSNLGAALAAYIVELKTGISYDTYVEELTTNTFEFEPNVWRHQKSSTLPKSYFQDKIVVPEHLPILYPTGGMLLSCRELSAYLNEMIKGYKGKSTLLKPESFQKMMSPSSSEFGNNGIFWKIDGNSISHNGGNYGTICLMSFDKDTGIGKLFITNISSYKNDEVLQEVVAIWNKIKSSASAL